MKVGSAMQRPKVAMERPIPWIPQVRRRRVVRLPFGAELNGLVDSIAQMLLLQCALHQIYCGTGQFPERMNELLERWKYVSTFGPMC